MSTSKNLICIEEARTWVKKWQTDCPNNCKAFLIPTKDLVGALEEMGVLKKKKNGDYRLRKVNKTGVRAYMAIDKNIEEGGGEKLLVVGTRIDCNGVHRDIVEDEKPSGCADGKIDTIVSNLNGSGVFDFTAPCPTTCDKNLSLIHI